MSNNTGGPAFPGVDYLSQHGKKNPEGMTLRDYFAAKAMQGMLSGKLINTKTAVIAQDCYAMADAMLKQREVSNGS